MSFSLFGCQSGKIDKMIIGIFANAQETNATKHSITTTKANNNISSIKHIYQDLEIPAYFDQMQEKE